MFRLTSALVLATVLNIVAVRGDEAPAAKPASRAPKLSELFGDDVIARGKGVQVKRSQLEEALAAFRATLALRGQQLSEAQRPYQESQLLQQLVITQVLTNRIKAEDLKPAAGFTAEYIADAKRNATSEEGFKRQLKIMGQTQEQFDRRVTEQSFVKAVIQREVGAGVKITDAQVQSFYDTGTDLLVRLLEADLAKILKDPAAPPKLADQFKERIVQVRKNNLARLEQPERVRVSHIFMTTIDRESESPLPEERRKIKREQMEKLRKRALGGEDFAKLIQEYSEDRGIKQTKGEYTFSREDGFSIEFKSAAFSLQPGGVSDVVVAANGLHIIKLLEKMPAKKVEFQKAAADLKELLTEQEVQRALPDFFAGLTKEAGIEILDPKFRIVETDVPPTKQP